MKDAGFIESEISKSPKRIGAPSLWVQAIIVIKANLRSCPNEEWDIKIFKSLYLYYIYKPLNFN